jgi:hypothetical protein
MNIGSIIAHNANQTFAKNALEISIQKKRILPIGRHGKKWTPLKLLTAFSHRHRNQ